MTKSATEQGRRKFILPPFAGYLALTGTGLVALALAAPAVGIDQDGTWGESRILVLRLGLMTLALVFVPIGVRRSAQALSRIPRGAAAARPARSWSKLKEALSLVGRASSAATMFAGAGILIVGLAYWFLVTSGFWTRWTPTTHMYDLLGQAFLHGQLHLLVEPPEGLQAVPDPYDPEARVGLPILWDASYYQGRYYLYWGPVPGLIAAASRGLGLPLGDSELGFLFLLALLSTFGLLLREIWGNHFRDLPSWYVGFGVMAMGLANPLPWLLNPMGVYETAIIGGQLFLVGGLFAAYQGLGTMPESKRWNILSGFLWACAVGTRASLAPAVIFLTALLTIEILQRHAPRLAHAWRRIGRLWIPLLLGLVALGLYNHFRFGRVWELGHRYQLTGVNLNKMYAQALNLDNLPANLHNYLLNPVRTLPVFPFVKPRWGGVYFWPFSRLIESPDIHDTEQVTGLLMAFPFGLFAWALLPWITGRYRGLGSAPMENGRGPFTLGAPTLTWFARSAAGAAIAAFLPVVLYLVSSMRYMGDVVPMVSLMSVLGSWTAYRLLRDRGDDTAVLRAILWASLAASMAMGLLLGVTGYNAGLERLNPELFDTITRILAW